MQSNRPMAIAERMSKIVFFMFCPFLACSILTKGFYITPKIIGIFGIVIPRANDNAVITNTQKHALIFFISSVYPLAYLNVFDAGSWNDIPDID